MFYIDESGDLGFGPGSSKFFVVAVVCVNSGMQAALKRFVRKYRTALRLPRQVEMKAKATKLVHRRSFCRGLAQLSCSAHYVVVNKRKVKARLRNDTNILYNYVSGLILAPLMAALKHATIQLDCRTIKVASGNSLHDYLRIKLWFEMNSQVNVRFSYLDSRECLGIQAADFVANAVYRKYESGDSAAFDELAPILGEKKELFL